MKLRSLVLFLLATCPVVALAQQQNQQGARIPPKGSDVVKVIAHTQVGDWGTLIRSLEVTVNNEDVIKDLTASDFDFINNGPGTLYDPKTGEGVKPYEDDGITLEKNGNKLIINVKPFDAEGVRNEKFQKQAWYVTCKKSSVAFSMRDVSEKTIDIIDDCIHGFFSYAGLTREYMLYLPKDENGQVIKNVPLLVWQIGGGEYNQNMMTVALANKCLVSLPENNQKCATLVFALANPNYMYSASLDPEKIKLIDRNNALQMAFIDTLIKDGAVDGSKLFCAGASSGGGCTMRFMMQFPERFKAALPCCAMDPIVPIHQVKEAYDGQFLKDVTAAFQGKVYKWNGRDMELQDINLKSFLKLPLYFVHAQDDTTCKVISSQVYFAARKNLGAKDDVLRIYSDQEMKEYGFGGMLSHFSWCRMLNDYTKGSAMDWMVQKF